MIAILSRSDWPAFTPDPEFTADHLKWETHLLVRIRAVLDSLDPFTKKRAYNLTMVAACERGVWGNQRLTMRCFGEVCRREYTPNDLRSDKERIIAYCNERSLTPEQKERIMHLPIPYRKVDLYKIEIDKVAGPRLFSEGFKPNVAGAYKIQQAFAERPALQLDTLNDIGSPWIPWEGMNRWPELFPNQWYGLDVLQRMVVNLPFATERAAYEAYPRIRQERGCDIEAGIGRHYTLVAPGDFKMLKQDGRKGQEIPDSDDLDAFLGRSKKPAPRPWSALTVKGLVGQVKACKAHFQNELILIDPKANVGQEGHKALGMGVQEHIQKFGVELTVNKLQDHLSQYGEKEMAPKFSPDEWIAWQDAHTDFQPTDILAALNANLASRKKDAIKKISEWDLGLNSIEGIVKAYLNAKNKPNGSNPNQGQRPPQQNQQRQQQKPKDDEPPPPIDFTPLNTEEIRRKYTVQIKRFDKDQNKNVYSDYLKAPGRIMLFRHDHPIESGWSLTTEMAQFDAEHGVCIFKAVVGNGEGQIVAIGYGSATAKGSERYSGRYVEKAETAAIARVLGYAGYGTDDVEEEEFADSPVDEMAN